MMQPEEISVEQDLQAIKHHWQALNECIERLVMRAYAQEYTEKQYNVLGMLALEGVSFVHKYEKGQRIDDDFLRGRDELVQKARQLLLDFKPTQSHEFKNVLEMMENNARESREEEQEAAR